MQKQTVVKQFLIGCAMSLVVGAFFYARGGFDEGFSTGRQVAIIAGLTVFGGIVLVLRSSGTSAARDLGAKARAKRDEARDA